MDRDKTSQLVIKIGLIFIFLVGCSAPATPMPTPPSSPSLPAATQVAPGTAFVAQYDGTVAVSLENSQALEIQFLSLLEDSRCPSSVVCAWAGNAKVVIRVWVPGRPFKDFELNTHPDFPGYADYLQYRISLLDVYSTADDKFQINLPYESYSLELIVAKNVP